MAEQQDSDAILQRLEQLERQVHSLEQRVKRIEEREYCSSATQPTALPPSAEPPDSRDAIERQPVIPPPPVVSPLSREALVRITSQLAQKPPSAPPESPAPSSTVEEQTNLGNYWEQFMGGKGALWIGSLATLFALAFFLAYAWQFLGNAAKLAMGFGAGAALLAFGEYSRQRAQRWFSEGISGTSAAVLYLSVWAGAQRYQLFSPELSFALMAATVLLSVLLALRYDAMSLSILATVGGFLTPVLLRTDGGAPASPILLLTYVTALNAGILAVSLYRQWRPLVWLSFFATILLVAGWAEGGYQERFRWTVFAYTTLNFLLFLGCACFRSLIRRASTAPEEILLVFADAIVYTAASYALLRGVLGDYPALFALALAALFAILSALVYRRAPHNRSLRASLTGIALFFLTVAVPIQLEQDWLVVGWSVQAAILFVLGLRLGSPLLYRAGQIVWALSLLALAGVTLTVEAKRQWLFLNERGLPLLAATVAAAWMAVESRRAISVEDDLRPWYSALATLGGAWLLAQETTLAMEWQKVRWGDTWEAVALYSVAVVWAVYAPLVHWVGARTGEPWVRLPALFLATLTAVLPVWAMALVPAQVWMPFWNLRWFSSLLVGVSLALLAWMARREQRCALPEEAGAFGYLAVLLSALLWIALSAEVYLGFQDWKGTVNPQLWAAAAWFALVVLWSLLGALFVALGVAWNLLGMRTLGYLAGGAAVVVLLFYSLTTLPEAESAMAWMPLFNLRALAFLTSALAAVWIAYLLRRHSAQESPMDTTLTGGVFALAVALLWWGVTQETYSAFYYWHATGALQGDWQRLAQMAISLVWTLFGAVMLIVGAVRALPSTRLAALGLLGITALKVFLYDLSFLDTPMRILSFGGLGLTLMGISWLYSRYGIGRTSSLRHP